MKSIYLIASLLFFIFFSESLFSNEITFKLADNVIIDSIVVKKSERLMIVFSKQKALKTYKIALGRNPLGKKQFENDLKTPEGLYYIDAKNAFSKYHKNLNIPYPNKADIKYAKALGKSVGGEIKIHGLPNSYNEVDYTISDWTLGCIALMNTEIDELFNHIKITSPILILP